MFASIYVRANGLFADFQAHKAAIDSGGGVVKIPMVERHVRSLNLATSVGIGLYEAVRQLDGAVLPEEQQLDPLAPQSDYNAAQL